MSGAMTAVGGILVAALTMKSAAKTARASFISSEGWSRSWPKPTQRLDPMAVHAEAGDQHHEEEPEGPEEQRHRTGAASTR